MDEIKFEAEFDLKELKTVIIRISGPVDKLYKKGDTSSVLGGETVSQLSEASRVAGKIDPWTKNKSEIIDKLTIVSLRLENAHDEIQKLEEDKIADQRMNSYKQATFNSFSYYGPRLPESFEHLENEPITEIIPELREMVQVAIDSN